MSFVRLISELFSASRGHERLNQFEIIAHFRKVNSSQSCAAQNSDAPIGFYRNYWLSCFSTREAENMVRLDAETEDAPVEITDLRRIDLEHCDSVIRGKCTNRRRPGIWHRRLKNGCQCPSLPLWSASRAPKWHPPQESASRGKRLL